MKKLVMTEDDEYFENSTKFWICDHVYAEGDVKIIVMSYTGSAQRDCNTNLKLNHKIPIVFHNLKNYYLLLIMQEPDKFIYKINVIPNELEKDMSFNINNKLILVDSIQFLSSSLDSLVG